MYPHGSEFACVYTNSLNIVYVNRARQLIVAHKKAIESALNTSAYMNAVVLEW